MKNNVIQNKVIKQINVTGFKLSTLLGVSFIILKLCNVIDWSWFYVTMPLWLGYAILLSVIIVVLLFTGLILLLAAIFGR